MKRYWILIAILILASCKQEKIGYVDTVRLMENSQEKKDIESKYQAKSTSWTKKRDSISQALQIEAQALQTKVQSMSQSKAQEPTAGASGLWTERRQILCLQEQYYS